MSLVNSIEHTINTKLIDKHGAEVLHTLDKDSSLISSGLLDSLDFISMLMELENTFNLDIDFEDADPVQFTSYSGLVSFLCEPNNAE
ncbi:hypothetical protein PSECIP111951_02472 [Pseudoalteromonas holothuriae]|uniref:Carrier domain-containing protein n=1 Tax=Pseudoalteromonas holothuriae TaxID=2963714 RepID=A0A9W4VNF2_9GAMM|nr:MULTISPECIES: acyl carrier protein [unclassified Pseudoalteromonas]CAH9053434.1 hypothetical protein PSECIP111854_01170 [Pseudoalteromonas sp. CIP111854]CAH9061351.1 hypothetical protein PSECIP111951_02472 [Pseudoalteromonas sp. CIP111951]